MLTQSYTNNEIDTIYRLKQVFYRCVYTEESLNYLLERIRVALDSFSIYIGADMTINVRIKKSYMKKMPNFVHIPAFYYAFLGDEFRNFFVSNINAIVNEYNSIFGEISIEQVMYHITENIMYLIDIHTLQDNNIIIRL